MLLYLSYLFFRLKNKKYLIPIEVENYIDVSYGKRVPSHSITYIDLFSGKLKFKSNYGDGYLKQSLLEDMIKLSYFKIKKYEKYFPQYQVQFIENKILQIKSESLKQNQGK